MQQVGFPPYRCIIHGGLLQIPSSGFRDRLDQVAAISGCGYELVILLLSPDMFSTYTYIAFDHALRTSASQIKLSPRLQLKAARKILVGS